MISQGRGGSTVLRVWTGLNSSVWRLISWLWELSGVLTKRSGEIDVYSSWSWSLGVCIVSLTWGCRSGIFRTLVLHTRCSGRLGGLRLRG